MAKLRPGKEAGGGSETGELQEAGRRLAVTSSKAEVSRKLKAEESILSLSFQNFILLVL